VDFLVEPEGLKQRMGAWQALLARVETAIAHLNRLEGALVENDCFQMLPAFLGEHLRVMGRLRFPDGVELVAKQAAFGIKAIAVFGLVVRARQAGGAHAHALAGEAATIEIFAESAGAGRADLVSEAGNARGDLALVVVAPVRLAVGFEAPALVEMKQGSP